jgi:hypothetical protein
MLTAPTAFTEGATEMFVVELFLPLTDNNGDKFPRSLYAVEENTLTARFGGLTAFTGAPAQGIWGEERTRDDIIIFEIMTASLDVSWWRHYRAELEVRFRQQSIVIRATQSERI